MNHDFESRKLGPDRKSKWEWSKQAKQEQDRKWGCRKLPPQNHPAPMNVLSLPPSSRSSLTGPQ